MDTYSFNIPKRNEHFWNVAEEQNKFAIWVGYILRVP
jgi:hypothetical protein